MDCRENILSEDYVDFLVRVRDLDLIREQYRDICYEPVSYGWVVVHVAAAEVLPLSFAKYGYYPIPKLYGLMDRSSMIESGIVRVQNQKNLMLTGKNVIVGIIDDEIDYLHQVFRDEVGNSRIVAVWDQNDNSGTLPENISYGSEYSNEMFNEALKSDLPYSVVPNLQEEGGHGTFVAGIAAGSRIGNDFVGAAPDSMIAMVKLRPAKQVLRDFYLINDNAKAYSENDIMMGVRYLTELSVRLDKQLVICIGLGTSFGPHTTGTPLSQMLSLVAGREDTAVVLAMGNEGNSRHHYLGTVSTINEYDNVEIRVGENERGFLLELWGQQPDIFSVGIVAPSGERVERIQPSVNVSQQIEFIYEETVIYIDYKLIDSINGSQFITMRFNGPSPGIWKIRVYSDNSLSGYFNMWLPISEFLSSDTYFVNSSPYITLTQPAAANYPIAVGAYNHTTGSFWIDSGRGYTADAVVKPEIVAPGVDVYGPRSGANHNEFTSKSGTSIAAAHVAGAAAVIFEWRSRGTDNPVISTSNVKSLLILGANRGVNRNYPGPEFGYGLLDVAGVFEELAGI